MIKNRILKGLFLIILNSSYFLAWIYIFSWHDINYEEICDPMEKIWVKKELYKWRYEFLKFLDISRFYFDFWGIFSD